MGWITLGWFVLGCGLGFGAAWRLKRSSPRSRVAAPDDQTIQKLQNDLQQMTLAYQTASEMSHFKAGFLARTSHELRSPLNGVIGMHQLILSDLCDSPEEERDFVAQANDSALKLVQLLDNIISVARVDHGTNKLDLQPLQLAQVLQDVHTLTHLQVKNRNLRFNLQCPSPDLYVLADPRYLQQVLVYLIDSAVTQTPDGEITVSAHPDFTSSTVQIWIDDQRPLSARSEAINQLQSKPDPATAVPTPGLTLLLAQTLLERMQGHLEIAATGEDTTRIQCWVPLVREE